MVAKLVAMFARGLVAFYTAEVMDENWTPV